MDELLTNLAAEVDRTTDNDAYLEVGAVSQALFNVRELVEDLRFVENQGSTVPAVDWHALVRKLLDLETLVDTLEEDIRKWPDADLGVGDLTFKLDKVVESLKTFVKSHAPA